MSGKIILRIMKIILLIMKTILLIVGLETGYAERIRNAKKRCMYMNVCAWKAQTLYVYKPISGQDKPFINDGCEVQTIHSQPV